MYDGDNGHSIKMLKGPGDFHKIHWEPNQNRGGARSSSLFHTGAMLTLRSRLRTLMMQSELLSGLPVAFHFLVMPLVPTILA